MLDLACIHAAACDVALVDTAFRAAASPPASVGMMGSLCGIYQGARRAFPWSPEAQGLFALMDFQLDRLRALWVRYAVSRTKAAHGRRTARRSQLACKATLSR